MIEGIFILICGIVFLLLISKYEPEILILFTSMMGSYFIVRGVTFLIGGYPSED